MRYVPVIVGIPRKKEEKAGEPLVTREELGEMKRMYCQMHDLLKHIDGRLRNKQ